MGHCHPHVVKAGQDALAQCMTLESSIFGLSSTLASPDRKDKSYTERILNTLPEHIDQVLVFNSGSVANDFAIQIARQFTGHFDVVVFQNAFHGCLGTASSISPKTFKTPDAKPEWVHVLPVPDLFRGPYTDQDPLASRKYFNDAKAILDNQMKLGRKVYTVVIVEIKISTFVSHYYTSISDCLLDI